MIQIISLILNALLTSGMIVTLFTLRATRKKATAEASSAEIDNAQKLVNDFDTFIVKPLKSQVERPRGQVPGSTEDPGTCPHGRPYVVDNTDNVATETVKITEDARRASLQWQDRCAF